MSPSLGASITACRSLNRHVVALEPEVQLYDEILLPLILASEEVESESKREPESQHQRKRSTLGEDEEVERKTAPKRKCT